MNIQRTPVTESIMPKTIVLYQLDSQDEAFGNNLYRNMMEDFIPMSQMIPVLSETVQTSMGNKSLLDAWYSKLGNGDVDARLQYPVSIGDVIKIDDTAYRCEMFGWSKM